MPQARMKHLSSQSFLNESTRVRSTVDLGSYVPPRRDNRLEQLTDVRNYVRREIKLHPGADSAVVTVKWQDEIKDVLTFDQNVGYPDGTTSEQWLGQWKLEANK